MKIELQRIHIKAACVTELLQRKVFLTDIWCCIQGKFSVRNAPKHAASVTGIISKKSSEEPYASSYWGRIYQCTQCSKAFTPKKQTFFTHMRIHTGENYTNAATVMWHLQKGLVLNHTWELILDRSHSIVSNKWRETLLMQQLLYKDFSQNDHLVNHLRIHTD